MTSFDFSCATCAFGSGFSRFDKRHRGVGPRTATVVERVDSSRYPLEVKLGSLGIYGSDTKSKLGISLISQELAEEAEGFEEEFQQRGFPLRRDPNDGGEYIPHCSIALLYNDNLAHFQDPRTLGRLNHLTGLGVASTQTIVLKPVKN